MQPVILTALNTRHTHANLATASLQAYWNKEIGRIPLLRCDYELQQNPEAVLADLIVRQPRVVAFSTYIWSLMPILSLSGALRAACPETVILLGGPEVTFNAADILTHAPWINGIVCGEGEITFTETLSAILAGQNPAGFPGLVWNTPDGPVVGPERPLIANLDSLPSPFLAGIFGNGRGFTYYEASRGCPSQCSYCLSSVLGKVRHFSLARVKEELDWFFASDYQQVRFADRTFNLLPERAKEIVRYILRGNKKHIGFHFEIQADLLNEELIDLFGQAPAGLFHLEIGVQSTHQPALQAVNRRSNLERVAAAVQALRQRTGCHIHLDLLGGLPHDTLETFCQSLDDCVSWQAHTVQVGTVKVLHGTSLRRAVESGEVACQPFPPYQIVRTAWLSAIDAIAVADMGKLVEGVYNPGKWRHTINFLITHLFDGRASAFFSALAAFWRERRLLFYGFTADQMQRELPAFVATCQPAPQIITYFNDLLLHEQRLLQKIPSGAIGPLPQLPAADHSRTIKPAAGLKVFWYTTDPQLTPTLTPSLLSQLPTGPFPVIYRYQRDLSAVPDTSALVLSMPQRLVLAFLAAGLSLATMPNCPPVAGGLKLTEPEIQQTLEVLHDAGFLHQYGKNVSDIGRKQKATATSDKGSLDSSSDSGSSSGSGSGSDSDSNPARRADAGVPNATVAGSESTDSVERR